MALNFLLRLAAAASLAFTVACGNTEPTSDVTPAHAEWPEPDPALLADGPHKDEVLYGEALIRRTYELAGPGASSLSLRYAGNNLACGSCHLDGGRRRYGLSFIGVTDAYPRNMARENAEQSLAQRINGCFERSMNGRPLPEDSREMAAMVAYIEFLSEAAPAGMEGRGAPAVALLDRPADPARGELVYRSNCVTCHGADGQGLRNTDGPGYAYPPLWGPDSFNTGAGMHRIITAANFIRANMPYGVTHDAPQLTDEQAIDVAAFINVQARPERRNLDRDYPNRALKPVDAPFPPYDDDFSQEQHTFGPWPPITAARETRAHR